MLSAPAIKRHKARRVVLGLVFEIPTVVIERKKACKLKSITTAKWSGLLVYEAANVLNIAWEQFTLKYT